MESEKRQTLALLEPLIVCIIFSFLYCIAGSSSFGGEKWLRRFLAPFLFALWAFLRSHDIKYLLQMPFTFLSLSVGYGGDVIGEKIVRRTVFGIANAASFSLANLFNKRFALAILQVILVVATSVILGVWNPVDNAIAEQFLIAFMLIMIPAFSVRILRPRYRE